MTQRNAPLAAVAALALAACQQSADETNIAIDNDVNAAEAADADVEALPPSESGGEDSADAAPTDQTNAGN